MSLPVVWRVYLYGFWRVSVPQQTAGNDGFNGDLSGPVVVFDKVCDGAEVGPTAATQPIRAGSLGQNQHT